MSRHTAREASTLTTYLTSYILTLPGILSVSDASASFSGHAFSFSCTAHTENGDTASVSLTF